MRRRRAQEVVPRDWFYISFADEQRFLGGAYVRGKNGVQAVYRAARLGINPGGQAAFMGPLPDVEKRVPAENRERLLTEQEINQ